MPIGAKISLVTLQTYALSLAHQSPACLRSTRVPQDLVRDDDTVPSDQIRKLLSFKMITSQNPLDKA
jgi:hypothetical protein